MYSPRISKELIPKLYEVARALRKPMTQLVNEILKEALARIESSLIEEAKGGVPDYTGRKGGESHGKKNSPARLPRSNFTLAWK